MTPITDFIAKNISDFHDSIREESANLLISMTERFLPASITLDPEISEKLTMMKANIINGLPAILSVMLKE